MKATITRGRKSSAYCASISGFDERGDLILTHAFKDTLINIITSQYGKMEIEDKSDMYQPKRKKNGKIMEKV